MKKNILLCLLSLSLAGALSAQSTRLGQHDAVTSWKAPVNSFASVSEGRSIAQQIMDIVGLKPNFEVQAANVPNAAAVVYRGRRYILYNPAFIDNLTKATGTRWAAISVLAHEIGHHLNGHTITASGSQPSLELDADEFSGFVLQKMGASLSEAQVAMKLAAQQRASKTHPGQYDRLAAIQKGYDRAAGKPADVAAAKPQPEQRTASAPARTQIADRNIIGDVRFHADPDARYYVTTQMNLVKLNNNRLHIIGKMGTLQNRQYPYYIYDEQTQLLVDTRGNILTRQGRQVGVLQARRS